MINVKICIQEKKGGYTEKDRYCDKNQNGRPHPFFHRKDAIAIFIHTPQGKQRLALFFAITMMKEVDNNFSVKLNIKT
ncbi:hypothetical protein EPIR_3144 [Erwinia piriflorinigrans CFBP 5888]|uniref:Uncharacterized protein n=1 Tax=Erwinia piriflorinigrans CFBP 5888 TaxID=1161919 RepID=V5ZBX5_9GAMM|nr:hypothetical protein EPIR_3144 [Erwinia piriflorinigrans CFBP 5888]